MRRVSTTLNCTIDPPRTHTYPSYNTNADGRPNDRDSLPAIIDWRSQSRHPHAGLRAMFTGRCQNSLGDLGHTAATVTCVQQSFHLRTASKSHRQGIPTLQRTGQSRYFACRSWEVYQTPSLVSHNIKHESVVDPMLRPYPL